MNLYVYTDDGIQKYTFKSIGKSILLALCDLIGKDYKFASYLDVLLCSVNIKYTCEIVSAERITLKNGKKAIINKDHPYMIEE